MYTPVAQRGSAVQSGYTPVAERSDEEGASPVFNSSVNHLDISAPSVFGPTSQSTSPTEVAPGTSGFLPGSLAQGIVQSSARAGGTLVETGYQHVTGEPEQLQPENLAERLAFGSEPVKSLQSNIQETQKGLKQLGIPDNISNPYGAVVGVGSLALDLAPFAEEKNALTAIARVDDIAEAANIARKIGVEPNLINEASQAFIKAKSLPEAREAVDAIQHLQQTTKSYTPIAARGEATASEAITRAQLPAVDKTAENIPRAGEMLSSPTVGDIEIIDGRATKDGKSGFGLAKITSDHPEVLPHLEDALNDAKIVETSNDGTRVILESPATEERPAIRMIVDHQLGDEPKTFLNNAYFKTEKPVLRDGIEPSTSPSSEERSTAELPKPAESIAQDENNAIDRNNVNNEKAGPLEPQTPAEKIAEKEAYAARNESRPDVKIKVPQFAPQLLKEISESRVPGDIAESLSKRFPKLSDPAVAAIAKRLKDVKRTSDIEGILKSVASAEKSVSSKSKIIKPSKVTSGLPKAVADILSPEQRDAYMDAATRAITDKDDAVLAQQEYDALWEQADQKVLDRYNELNIMRDIYREQVGVHPGRELMKYVSKTTGRLPEVTGSEFMKSLTGSGKNVRTGEFGRTGDSIAKELGFESGESAQKAVDDYSAMRDSLRDIDQEIRELRPRARAVRILQDMQEDVPVITRKDAGNIDSLTDKDAIRYDYRDISGFQGTARDVYRNFESFFGKNFPEVKKTILDPFDASKGAMVDEVVKLGDEIESGIVKKYGFNRGSRESKAIMDYGERAIAKKEKVPGIDFENTTRDGLVRKFGTQKADQIIEAEGWFRKEYDRLIDEANKVREAIYPNNPTKLIPKRKDYFRHFQEMGTSFRDLLSLFETPAGIDPKLAGISEFTAPQSKFLSLAQERIGQGSERDAIGGFLNYAPSFSYMKHIDPHIGQFRYLRRKLAENAPTPGTTELVEKAGAKVQVRQKGVNNFLTYLNHFANDLAGKTNPAERYIQEIMPGGRTAMKVINFINSRIKANQILGNVSSSLAQAFNLPQGIASAKQYMITGAQRSLADMFVKDAPMQASSFLKERYTTPLTSRFKLDWAAHPVKAGTERAQDAAAWMTQALDEVATKWMWNAHYDKGLAEGAENPIKYADDVTRKLVAGRGVGEVPLLQKSKIFQMMAPFTLEVGNTWSVMKEFAQGKNGNAIATLALFFAASYLMNEGAQKVRGSRVVFDPVNSLLQGISQAADEMKSGDDPGRIALKFGGRQLGEVLSNIPLGSTFAAAVPDQFSVLGQNYKRAEVFGGNDPGRFGSPLLTLNAFSDPFYKLFPPFGGAQVKRTQEAVQSMLSGEVKSANGKTSYKTPTDAVSLMQAFLFGKSATAEAQQSFDERDDLFNRVYTQDANRSQLSLDAEESWADIKTTKQKEGGPAAAAKMAKIAKDNPDLAQKIVSIAAEEKKGMTATDRLIGQLGVANGERAKYISITLQKMKTPAEKVSYIKDLSDKKLLDSQVVKQVTYLLTKK